MAFLGSIGKFIGKFLFGSGDKVEYIPPKKLILKPTKEEKQLLADLFPYLRQNITRAKGVSGLGVNLPTFALTQYQRYYPSTLKTFGKSRQQLEKLSNLGFQLGLSTTGMLKNIAQGQLPSSFQRAIKSQFSRTLGDILNTMAIRGVINSSITQRAISDAVRRAIDEQVKYLPIASELATKPLQSLAYTSRFTTTPLEIAMQEYSFATGQPINLFNALRGIERSYIELPANLYAQMMSVRHRVMSQPVVRQGSPGLFGALAPGIGTGLGMALGMALF